MHHEYGPLVPVLLEEDIPAWLVIGYREGADAQIPLHFGIQGTMKASL